MEYKVTYEGTRYVDDTAAVAVSGSFKLDCTVLTTWMRAHEMVVEKVKEKVDFCDKLTIEALPNGGVIVYDILGRIPNNDQGITLGDLLFYPSLRDMPDKLVDSELKRLKEEGVIDYTTPFCDEMVIKKVRE